MSGYDRIAQFDDFQAVRFVQHFGGHILAGCDASPEVLRTGLDTRLTDDERLGAAFTISPIEAGRILSIAEAAPAARAMLALWATDRRVAPALEVALDEWRDDEMVAEVILSVGFVLSLLMCTASIEFKGTIGPVTFSKGGVPVEQIKALIEPFVALIGGRKA